jgi:integral membrane protein
VSDALQRFRVMAVVVGVGLLVLCAGIVVRYGFGHPGFSQAYSPVHGLLYLLYLVTVADLGRRARWPLGRTVGVALAGVVPLLSFVVERRVVAAEQRAVPGLGGRGVHTSS